MKAKSFMLKTGCVGILTFMTGLQVVEGGGAQPKFDETRTTNIAHTADAGLNVRTDNGAITVKQSDRADVEIIAHIRCVSLERLEAVEIIAERMKDNTLKIYPQWPGLKRKNNEGCSFELLLPDARSLELRTANGKIECEGFGGNALLKTSNGKITIARHKGPVDASTSNGAINLHHVAGSVKASTSNGKIDIQNIAGTTELRTSNGAIHAKTVTSPVKAHTSNGSISLELAPSFTGEMTASTSHGSLDISDLGDAKLISSGKKRITFSIGDSEHKSSASTSNGSIRIKRSK